MGITNLNGKKVRINNRTKYPRTSKPFIRNEMPIKVGMRGTYHKSMRFLASIGDALFPDITPWQRHPMPKSSIK